MKRKVKIFLGVILCLIVCSMIINVIYALNMRIDEPIYVAKYNQIYISEKGTNELQISYIKDNRDSRKLVGIEIEGIDRQLPVFQHTPMWSMFDDGQSLVGKGRFYTHCSYYVELSYHEDLMKQIDDQGKYQLTKAKLIFNDHSTMDVDIGSIYLTRYKEDRRIRSRSGSGNDFGYKLTLQVDGPIEVTAVEFINYDFHKEDLNVSLIVDDGHVFTYDSLKSLEDPIEVKRQIKVIYESVHEKRSEMWRFDIISLGIHYQTEGEEDVFYVPFTFSTGYMEDASVEAYVKMWRSMNE